MPGAAYGGVAARVLCVLRDPGRKTNDELGGSGLLSPENDDPTARRFSALLDAAGIRANEILAWNAYPWYINDKPSPAELGAGVEPLRELLGILPRLRVVNAPRRVSAERLEEADAPASQPGSPVRGHSHYHTSSQAFIGTPEVRAQWMADLAGAFARGARMLQEATRPDGT